MYSTEGIIIKKEDRGENDKMITFLSKDYGKIRVLAKGVRKNTSKLAGHLELFSFVEISFVLGKNFNVLTSSLNKDEDFIVCIDYFKKKAVYNILNLIDKYTLDNHKDDDVYNLLFLALKYIKKRELKDIELIYFSRYFEYKFLTLLGYTPKEKDIRDFFKLKFGFVNREFLFKLERIFLRYFENIL